MWLPTGGGTFVLRAEVGRMAGVLDTTERPTGVPDAEQQEMAAAGTMAVLDDRELVALQGYYCSRPMPFFGGSDEKWRSISRVAAHAARQADAATQPRETLDDRTAGRP